MQSATVSGSCKWLCLLQLVICPIADLLRFYGPYDELVSLTPAATTVALYSGVK